MRGREPAFLRNYVRNLRGGSQPILAEASDGYLYVVKFMNNPQGQNVPFNESMGMELYRLAGLPVPLWRPLFLTAAFIAKNPGCAIQTRDCDLRSTTVFCFGSRYLGTDDKSPFEILPGSRFGQIRNRGMFWLAWLLDVCACHSDNRQCIFDRSTDGTYGTHFIDHGCMFGGPNGDQKGHHIAPRYLDRRIYEDLSSSQARGVCRSAGNIDLDLLWNEMDTLPDGWKTDSARRRFSECLAHLSDRNFVDDAIDKVVGALNGIENHGLPHKRCDTVLRSRLLSAGTTAC